MLSFTVLEPVRHLVILQREEGLGPLAIYTPLTAAVCAAYRTPSCSS